MNKIKEILLTIIISIPCVFLGKHSPLIGEPVFSILFGMLISIQIKNKKPFEDGLKFVSKKVLQYAVILLGFSLNLKIIQIGKSYLPIILLTIATSLTIGYIGYRYMNIDKNIATLISVGSSICGASAIAATAPIINASDEEVVQSISVIFIFNVIAALIFPSLGMILGMDSNIFGLFAGTAINDTSYVTAASSTWDNIFNLGHMTLDAAVTVKLTRTLAIIPITLFLSKKRK